MSVSSSSAGVRESRASDAVVARGAASSGSANVPASGSPHGAAGSGAEPGAHRAARATLSGWGRYPVAEMDVHRPEGMPALRAIVRAADTLPLLGRGLGRSYGDAAMNSTGGVVLSTRLDRFLGFDPASGVVTCEAGVTFESLLRTFVPRGWFPPVVPGTKHVTLGGAVAADVHGKNHHRAGSIARHLVDFVLVTADGGRVRCAPDERPDLFRATVGGMGLTGILAEVRLRLRRVSSAYVAVDYDRAPDLDTALALFRDSDHLYEHSVAWIDCLAKGRALGRSVLMRGNALAAGDLAGAAARDPLGGAPRGTVTLPMDLPGGLLNRVTVGAFNAAYYRMSPCARGVVTHHEPFFFPLDRMLHWNRLYGRRGFLQYQCVVPHDGGRDALVEMLEALARSQAGSFLAVLKTFGPAEPGAMLSFPMPGYTLALDLAYRPAVLPLLDRLDAIVADRGGRVYLAKDARMSPETFRRTYADALPAWQAIRHGIDPTRRFASDLSRRLELDR